MSSGPDATSEDAAAADSLPPTRPPAETLHLHADDVLKNVDDAFLALDHEWRIVYANRRASEIAQKPWEHLQSQKFWDIWPAVLGTEMERHLRRVMTERSAAHLKHYYAEGPNTVWLEGDAYPSEAGVNLFYRDVTDRKHVQEELRRSEERYRSLVAAMGEIVWTNTPEGEMDGSNAAWGSFTGQSEAEYQGFGWAEAVHSEDAQPTVDAWNRSVASRTMFAFEHRLRRHDGVYRIFAIRAVPVLENDGTIREWVGIHTDVTERREMEAAQAASAAQQRQFLRDVLASVTEGRLHLCRVLGELPPPLTPFGVPVSLTQAEGLRELRQQTQGAAQAAGLLTEKQFDLMTAASEAGMNAIVHAGGGTGQVSFSPDGVVQVRVEDHGGGIDTENLPKATLARGFSTKATLGHGLKLMLETGDRLFLLTGPSGTTVVLEKDRDKPLLGWMSAEQPVSNPS